jgi:hypothetical protein
MSRILEEIINNPGLLSDLKNKPAHNLIKIQTITGSTYLGYIKDCDEEGIWFEPLQEDFHPAFIFKSDIKKIIVPTNPDEEKEILKKQKSWFKEE